MNITTATADAGGFIPEIWAQKGLDLLKPDLRVTRRIARDSKFSDAFGVGDQLSIQVPGTFNAPKKSAGSQVSLQDPRSFTTVSLTLNTHRCTDILIEDVAQAQANTGLQERYMKSLIAGMARAIEQDSIATLMAASNSNGTAGTDITATAWRAAMVAMNNRMIPEEGRNFVLSPKDYAAALADADLKGFFQYQSADAFRQAQLGMIYGFDTFQSQLAPATAVQRLTFANGNNGETFRLVWNGFETADIAFNSTAATLVSNIQTALRAMTEPIAMGSGTVSVAGSNINAIDVTFASTALRYPSALTYSVAGVSGTAYSGTCSIATTGTVTTTNLAFHEDAAIFVPRMFKPIPQGAGVVVTQVTDDDPEEGTGITLRVMGSYSQADRGYRIGIDVLYGVAQLRDSACQRLVA